MTAMERWTIGFEPQAPFLVSRRLSLGNLRETEQRIPGRTLRGALAGLLQAADAALAEDLYAGRLVIGDARPTPEGWPTLPIPASLRSCKRFPGLAIGQEKHGFIDLLLTLLRRQRDPKVSIPSHCPICEKGPDHALTPLKPLRGVGFQRVQGSGRPLYREVKMEISDRTHSAMDHLLGTVAPGFLYDEEFILPTGGWSAVLTLPAGRGAQVKAALTGRTVRIGASRTRGLGQWKIATVEPERQPWGLPPLAERLQRFQEVAGPPAGELLLPMLCVTPVVLPDALGRFTIEPDPFTMANALDPAGTCLTAERLAPVLTMADLERVGGWNSLPQLPAPSDLAFMPGSVLVWKARTADLGAVAKVLSEVERKGLGYRRAEGLGIVVFAHPIHCEVREHVQ